MSKAFSPPADDLLAAVRRAAQQEQFLNVASPDEAFARFTGEIDLAPSGTETVPLAAALERVLAQDVSASIDVPPFDRASVDGFAVRSADTRGAAPSAPRRLRLNGEVITCGHAPAFPLQPGWATTLATGAMIPRGADAVVMIEHTDLIEEGPAIEVRRAAGLGQFISYAGSDIARGEVILRRKTRISSREIGMLAACGLDQVECFRKPKVAVLSTGDELVAPGHALSSGRIYDSNGAIIAAAVAEAGGEPVSFGILADEERALEQGLCRAIATCDLIVLSGGTSKGAGDLSYRVVAKRGRIIAHGVALKPGKPLCLAVIEGKPLAVLPGFPTSAIFTFHSFVAPIIRARAGLAHAPARSIEATVPVRIASELGRKEFVLVNVIDAQAGPVVFPSAKGSGAVTSFSQADGFVEIDALASALDAGSRVNVRLIGSAGAGADLVIMGSHDVAFDVILGALAEAGFAVRNIAIGSLGGVAALERGECDLAPVHIIDPETGRYNEHLVRPGLDLVKGWRRMQGFVSRPDDERFAGADAAHALERALAEEDCLMVNRNAGSGTRVLIDRLLAGARPPGYGNQPRSHNAVAAAIAQGRADWGIAIEPVATLYGLSFAPLAPENYDFLLRDSARSRPALAAFLASLRDESLREKIRELGMQIGDT